MNDTIFCGLVENGQTAIIQARYSVDYLDCELLEYYGERVNTFENLRAAFEQSKARVLAEIQAKYPNRNFNAIELDTGDTDANLRYADCRGDDMAMIMQELAESKPQTQTAQLTQAQQSEMERMKMYFPYRIVWGQIVGGEFKCHASYNRRAMNASARAGYPTFTLETKKRGK